MTERMQYICEEEQTAYDAYTSGTITVDEYLTLCNLYAEMAEEDFRWEQSVQATHTSFKNHVCKRKEGDE